MCTALAQKIVWCSSQNQSYRHMQNRYTHYCIHLAHAYWCIIKLNNSICPTAAIQIKGNARRLYCVDHTEGRFRSWCDSLHCVTKLRQISVLPMEFILVAINNMLAPTVQSKGSAVRTCSTEHSRWEKRTHDKGTWKAWSDQWLLCLYEGSSARSCLAGAFQFGRKEHTVKTKSTIMIIRLTVQI